MARQRRNKLFDLFKNDFKITFFYKPSMNPGDEYYYIILDDLVKLHIKIIKEVAVIDAVYPITKSYIAPFYEKLVQLIMAQSKITILVSTIGDTSVIHQECIKYEAPLIDDEDYITVPKEMYTKWKSQNIDNLKKYGFYILSVSDEVPLQQKEITVKDVKPEPREIIKQTVKYDNTKMNPLKTILTSSYSNIVIDDISNSIISCSIDEVNTFAIEYRDNSIYIKELLINPESNFNLIQVMNLLNTFEEFIKITSEVYIINITHSEVYRLCNGKGYEFISEYQKLPINNLFKQAFQGFGTYKLKIIN